MLNVFLIGGIALVLLEVILPGGVVAPLGLGALLVAGLVWIGVLDGWIAALTTWFIASLVLILVTRFVFQRFMPGEEERAPTDEDAEAYDRIVEVTETIPEGRSGRISFRGSSWPATCYQRTLVAGERAKIFYRDGVTWVVTPIGDDLTETPPEDGRSGAPR